ncbi:putative nucleic acid-binding Zn-ribbon protein [Caldicoprobacter guelmensis]|uniref:hypothetical protein n=1 Tax=Caldicoprobacter guelmensis TaxID=1170224 RepID=UPI0019567C70|nr:hypothetical protein [Caldicoprobacter guelmensis]MBM7582978.1 putative nucleic acid-binding Zn-ribbon protein [Caldicoprobacter guelmensis]
MSMSAIGECMDLESLKSTFQSLEGRNYDERKCIICGSIVKFYDDEYKKPCKRCGTMVFLKIEKPKIKRQIKCWVCMDKGIVQFPIQADNKIYYYVARCNCPAGMKYPSTIPLLAQCEMAPREEFIELENRKTCAPDTVLV